MAADESWADLARSSRECLALLGYAIEPRCLPGELEPCGATNAQHTAAHLATLRAVIDHHAEHLGADFDFLMADVYRAKAAEFSDSESCQGVHP